MGEHPGHLFPKFKTEWGWGVARILMGWLFLWGFLDKTFGLGYATRSGSAWIEGVSPTTGFLEYGTKGPFEGFYQSLAGNGLVDIVFMMAMLALGLALILGIGMRLAFYGGTVLNLIFWSTVLPPEFNPLIDEHIIYIAVLFMLERVKAGRYLGLGNVWSKTRLVRKFRWME